MFESLPALFFCFAFFFHSGAAFNILHLLSLSLSSALSCPFSHSLAVYLICFMFYALLFFSPPTHIYLFFVLYCTTLSSLPASLFSLSPVSVHGASPRRRRIRTLRPTGVCYGCRHPLQRSHNLPALRIRSQTLQHRP